MNTTARRADTSTVGDFLALLPFLRTERTALIWTIAVDLIAHLSLIGLSVVTARLVAEAAIFQRAASPGWWVAGALLALVRPVITWHEMDVSHATAYRVLAALRMALFDGFSRGIPSPRGVHSGELASTTMTEVEKLEFFYAHTVAQLVAAALIGVGAIPVLIWVNPVLAGVFVLGCLLLLACSLPLMRRGAALGRTRQRALAEFSEKTVDVLSGLREILVFAQNDRAVSQVHRAGARLDESTAAVRLNTVAGEHLRDGVVVLTALAVAVVAFAGDYTDPVVVPCILAGTLTLMAPLAQAVEVLATIQPLRGSAAKVREGIQLGEVAPAAGAPPVAEAGDAVVCTRGARFAYPGKDALVLPDLTLLPGEHVGVAGPSGSGKSTLARVLSGLWAPTDGAVQVAGAPVQSYAPEELARRVQLVEQETPLFHGSLAENLRLGAPDVTDEQLLSVLERVGLRPASADFPLTLSAAISEGGRSLSGGQRARLGLARALLREPDLLILDETTAALDAANEARVMEVVRDLPCAVLVISHRDQTLATLPRVVRFDAAG